MQTALLPSDDEEESKASVIKKKAKVDPFAPKEKSKKRHQEAPKALNEHPSFQKLGGPDGEAPATPAPSEPPVPGASTPATPLSVKKKKKKKNRSSAPQLIIERPKSPHAAQTTPERPTASTSSAGATAAAAAESPRTSAKVEPITETCKCPCDHALSIGVDWVNCEMACQYLHRPRNHTQAYRPLEGHHRTLRKHK